MKRLLLAVVLALVPVVVACGEAPKVDRIEIVESGIYQTEIAKTRQASEAVNGTTNELAGVKLVSSTTTIPARIGTKFGFRYRVVGSPSGASVKMTVIVHFPGEGLRNPKTGKLVASDVTSWTRNIGVVTYSGYSLDEEWELVPGTWTFEILYEGRKIAEQSFTLVK